MNCCRSTYKPKEFQLKEKKNKSCLKCKYKQFARGKYDKRINSEGNTNSPELSLILKILPFSFNNLV